MAQAQAYVDRGFRDLKVRVAAGHFSEDLHRIAALQLKFGDRVKIAADANGRWSEREALDNLKVLELFRRRLCRTAGGARRLERHRPPGRNKARSR